MDYLPLKLIGAGTFAPFKDPLCLHPFWTHVVKIVSNVRVQIGAGVLELFWLQRAYIWHLTIVSQEDN